MSEKRGMAAIMMKALQEVADLTPAPDNHVWSDMFGDPNDYPTWATDADGKRKVYMEGVDISNRGDMQDFGYERGLLVAAEIARAALTKAGFSNE